MLSMLGGSKVDTRMSELQERSCTADRDLKSLFSVKLLEMSASANGMTRSWLRARVRDVDLGAQLVVILGRVYLREDGLTKRVHSGG